MVDAWQDAVALEYLTAQGGAGSNNANFDSYVIEALIAQGGTAKNVNYDAFILEELTTTFPSVTYGFVDGFVTELLVAGPPVPTAFPVFPQLPYGFPIKLSPGMHTVIGKNPSDREVRVNNQVNANWQMELLFDELRDQTQNQTAYAPLAGYTEFQQLCGLFLQTYGKGGIFAFDAPWDDSRLNMQIGTGDASTYGFTIYRTWGSGANSFLEPIGMINQVFGVFVNGVPQPPTSYKIVRNKIWFIDQVTGQAHAPLGGAIISMSFSFYYLCRFVDNNQEFQEFAKNRWTVPNLKFTSIIWN